MSISASAQINTNTNFKPEIAAPIDNRQKIATTADTVNIGFVYPGAITYINDKDSMYYRSHSGWKLIGTASTEYLEPYIVAGDTVGVIMKNVQDTVAFEGEEGSTGGGCDCATTVTLADHFVTTSSTALNTSLTYTFPEAGLYMIRFYGAYTSSLTTNGCRIKFNWTGAIQFGTGYWKGSIASNASVATELMRSIGSIGNDELVTSGVVPTSAAHNLEGQYLRNVPAGATLTIQFGAELSATSTTLIAGSTLIIQKL